MVKNSHARGENSSVDGKHISDFMGKRRVELYRTIYLPFGYLSHGGSFASGDNPDWVRSSRSDSTSPGREPQTQRRNARSSLPRIIIHTARAVSLKKIG